MHNIAAKSAILGFIAFFGAVVDEHTNIPIGVALSLALAWGSTLWYLRGKFKDLEAGQRQHTERLNNLRCQQCSLNATNEADET